MELTHTVTPEENGKKLNSVLRGGMKLSSGMVKRLKWNGGLLVDGEVRHTDWLVTAGEEITALLDIGEPEPDVVPEAGELDVLYEDEWLMVVNKPVGIIVHPSHSRFNGTLANFTAYYLEKSGQPAVCHAVNRLDRDTSGCVLFAKSSHVQARLSASLETAEKLYYAVALGAFEPPEGTIDLPIVRLREGDMFRAVGDGGQRAVTHYATLRHTDCCGREVSALRLRLETGRTHQIRVHCMHLGHPLLGDGLYKTAESAELSAELGISGQLLHAGRLAFTHPLTGERISVTAPLRGIMRPFFAGTEAE